MYFKQESVISKRIKHSLVKKVKWKIFFIPIILYKSNISDQDWVNSVVIDSLKAEGIIDEDCKVIN